MKISILKYSDPILDHLKTALQKQGHECRIIDAENRSNAEIRIAVEMFKPDFCLTNNFYLFDARADGPELENYFLKQSIPLVIWHFEPPWASGSIRQCRRWHQGEFPKSFLYLAPDSYCVEAFRQKGLTAEHLPLGVSSELAHFKASDDLLKKFQFPLVHIGRPAKKWSFVERTVDAYANWHCDFFRHELWNVGYEMRGEQKSDLELLNQYDLSTMEAFSHFFHQITFDPRQYLSLKSSLRNHIQENVNSDYQNIFEYLSGRLDFVYSHLTLLSTLSQLTPAGLRVFGGDPWKEALPNYAYETPRISDEELLACYQSSQIVFCMTKQTLPHFMHDRPMAVLAVGGFPLTDERADAHLLFNNDELVTYASPEELGDKIHFYLKNPAAREAVIEAGRKRVLRDHTYDRRAQSLVEMATKNV